LWTAKPISSTKALGGGKKRKHPRGGLEKIKKLNGKKSKIGKKEKPRTVNKIRTGRREPGREIKSRKIPTTRHSNKIHVDGGEGGYARTTHIW